MKMSTKRRWSNKPPSGREVAEEADPTKSEGLFVGAIHESPAVTHLFNENVYETALVKQASLREGGGRGGRPDEVGGIICRGDSRIARSVTRLFNGAVYETA